ncbi:exonuclease [Gordonia phage Culver]|nr:exonuclease [Gordonia phage Culver]
MKASEDAPWSVARYNQEVGKYVDRLGDIWVEGQLVRVHRPKGHVVFIEMRDTEKKQSISVTATANVVPHDIADGDHVKVFGHPQYWNSRGSLSLRISQIMAVGVGALQNELEAREAKLEAEGLFHPRHKQTLPRVPKCIGLITAPNSDAEKDVLSVARGRWPGVSFKLSHINVQGQRCAGAAKRAIEELDADPGVDVIILARGGGSKEDLLPWSDEVLVRAAFASVTPVVSAIGHENDRPLLDRVVDLRAATPTDAAKRVVPDVHTELRQIEQMFERIGDSVAGRIQNSELRIDSMLDRVAGAVVSELSSADRRTDTALNAVLSNSAAQLASHNRRIDALGETMAALDHQKVLNRGYAVISGVSGPNPPAGIQFTVTTKDGTFTAVTA